MFIRTRNRILDNNKKKQTPYTKTHKLKYTYEIWIQLKSGFHKAYKIWKIDKECSFVEWMCVRVCYFVDETIWIMFIFEWNLSNDEDLQLFCLYMCLLILRLYISIKKHGNCHTAQMKWWMLFLLKNYLQESEICLQSNTESESQ